MRYFFGFLVSVLLLVLVIFMIFSGGNGGSSKVANSRKTLASYAATDASVRLTIDGPVNAESEHYQTRISVDRNTVVFEGVRGYEGSVIKQQSFPNTQGAFENFLLALQRNGYANGDTTKELADERGRCATGQRYIFEVIQNGTAVQRFWATSCDGTETFKGNVAIVLDLFQQQVPGFNDLADNLPQ